MNVTAALGRLLTRLASATALLSITVGIPYGLAAHIGWPLPRAVPRDTAGWQAWLTAGFTDTMAVNLLAIALWLLWAVFTASLLAEAIAGIRGLPMPRLRGLTSVQTLAGWLLSGLTAGVVATATVAPATATLPPLPAVVPAAAAHATPVVLVGYQAAGPAKVRVEQQPPILCAGEHHVLIEDNSYVYVVQRNESLWVIAEKCLDDGNRWPEIWQLNRGRQFEVGGTLRAPRLIQPGWDLRMPADAVPPPATDTAPAKPARPPGTGPVPASPGPATSTAPPMSTPSSSTVEDPDGVVEPAPGMPAASGPASTPSSASPATSAQSDAMRPPGEDRGVGVPGGWVGIGLAAALVAASSIVWLRRRTRYNPIADIDPATDPTLQPLPAVVSRLRRAVREQAPELMAPPPPQPTVRDLAGAERPPLAPIGPSGPQLAGLPDHPRGGLGLTGPGGADAVRAMLVATLSSGGVYDPDARGQVVIPATVLADLLGGTAITDLVGAIPRLRVTAGLDHALTYVEEQIIHRTRAVTDADVTDVAALHDADPHHDPLPPITLIADIPDTAIRARLSTALHLGHPLAISAVIAGQWPRGTTLTVATDGTTTSNEPGQTSKLSVLDADTTLQLLTVIREAHTGEPPSPPPNDPSPEGPGSTSSGDDTSTVETTASPAPPVKPSPPAEPHRTSGKRQSRVRVQVLGRPIIFGADGNPVPGVRRASYELLTYLAVHRQGADIADIEVAMTPDATPRRARDRLSTNVANLRNRLTHATGLDPSAVSETFKPVVNPGGRYYLDPALLDVDWWRVLDAVSRAGATTDRDAQRAALDDAVSNWNGPLYDDSFEWIDGPQHRCRQVGVNIHARLAVLLADTDPGRARTLLDAACDIDPINEEVARLAMNAHAATDDTAAINARLAALTSALQEIDEDVSDDTHRLAHRLLHKSLPPTDGPSD
ncbi:BTAD domain-containing putative transcriptional regulator [Micromonospora sp. NPDC048905]|uniref:BTAD domain-containing putative transcriptional regulator n=1 Tax=Micromonospora sp. NPDC048905 TaxID=3155494 RepID=UPI0033C96090